MASRKPSHRKTNTPGVPPISVDDQIDFYNTCRTVDTPSQMGRLIKLAHRVYGPPGHERVIG
jgi:hypothetical protein